LEQREVKEKKDRDELENFIVSESNE